jgi:hypothetical protein
MSDLANKKPKKKKRKKTKKPKTYEGYFKLVEDEFFQNEIKVYWNKWAEMMILLNEIEYSFWKNINGVLTLGPEVRSAMRYSREILAELLKDTIELEKARIVKKKYYKRELE